MARDAPASRFNGVRRPSRPTRPITPDEENTRDKRGDIATVRVYRPAGRVCRACNPRALARGTKKKTPVGSATATAKVTALTTVAIDNTLGDIQVCNQNENWGAPTLKAARDTGGLEVAGVFSRPAK